MLKSENDRKVNGLFTTSLFSSCRYLLLELFGVWIVFAIWNKQKHIEQHVYLFSQWVTGYRSDNANRGRKKKIIVESTARSANIASAFRALFVESEWEVLFSSVYFIMYFHWEKYK